MEGLWQEDLLQALDQETASAASDSLKQVGLSAWRARWDSSLGRKGCVSQHALPHGGFAWAARLHPRVRRIFADLFDTALDQLCVGLDNPFWSAADASAAKSNDEWLHVDQNHCTGMTWPCVQGLLYVWSSEGESSSTTVVLPGSHRHMYETLMSDHASMERGRQSGGQSVRLNTLTDLGRREAVLCEAIARSRRVPCPAGSLLLWDSRTVHQGWAGGPRLAQPVCWEPRERRDAKALRRKLWMCAAGVPSSHSSSEARVHGMAPRRRPEAVQRPRPGAPEEGLAMVASILPFGVARGTEAEWEAMQDALWCGGNPHKSCERTSEAVLMDILRPEVVSAL